MNFSKQLEEVNKNRRAVGKTEVKMTNRHIEMLQILRDAPERPAIKYNSKYFENLSELSPNTLLVPLKKYTFFCIILIIYH